MDLAVIIAAAGASSRYRNAGGLRDKLDEDLGGRPVLQRTVELFSKRDEVRWIIVAGPHAEYDDFLARHGDKLGMLGVRCCRGGKGERYESIAAALALVPAEATHIAVHDAARPATPHEVIDRVLTAAASHGAVIPAIDVPDTVKRIHPEPVAQTDADPLDAILGGAGRTNQKARRVEATIDRRNLVLVQTPQVFRAELLRRAYAQPDLTSTDDASLIERLGEPVIVVEGDPRNVKLTRPADLHLVRAILGVHGPAERAVHKKF
jgi:2-C-methyl-D-erythritol 4-phosphate cytidylyltransferase